MTRSKKDHGKLPDSEDFVVTANGDVIRVTPRPTWRESESTTKKFFALEDGEQVSFQDGKQVVAGKKGSVRPDLYREGRSVEVKNYLINTPSRRNRLARVIAKQAIQRAKELPPGTRQTVRLDLSGQMGITSHFPKLAEAIEERSGGIIRREDVHWTVSLFPVESRTRQVPHPEEADPSKTAG